MSRTIGVFPDRGQFEGRPDPYHRSNLTVGSFFGGKRDRWCLQLMLEDEYVQLRADDARKLRDCLTEWLETVDAVNKARE